MIYKRHIRLSSSFLCAQVVPLALLFSITLITLSHRGVFARHIPPYDETQYYKAGAGVWQKKLPPWDYSPGFAFIYSLFANPWLSSDSAYHAIRFALVLSTVFLTFLALRPITGSPIALACTSILAINSHVGFVYTIYLASALIVAAALYIVGDTPVRAGLALALLLFGIMIRFEFAFPAFLATLLFAPTIAQRKRWFLPGVIVLLIVILYPCCSPEFDRDIRNFPGGRIYLAFGQHYAWSANDLRSWQGNRWFEFRNLLQRDFGDAHTLWGFFAANPRAFLLHINHNVRILPVNFAKALQIYRHIPKLFMPLLCLILSIGALLRASFYPSLLARIRQSAPKLKIIVSTLTMFLPWLIIRPRFDYQLALLPPFVFLLGLAAKIVFSSIRDNAPIENQAQTAQNV